MQKYPMKMSIKGAEGGIGRGWGITPWEVGVGFQSHRIILLRFWYFSIFSFSLSIILVSPGIATSIIIAVFSILVTIAISGLLSAMILWHCKFMSHISFWLTFSLTVWGLCRYHFSDFSRWIFHAIPINHLATLLWLLLYSLWASFEHSLTMWLIVSPFSTRRWINTFINVVFDIICSYCLFLCKAYQGLTWYF